MQHFFLNFENTSLFQLRFRRFPMTHRQRESNGIRPRYVRPFHSSAYRAPRFPMAIYKTQIKFTLVRAHFNTNTYFRQKCVCVCVHARRFANCGARIRPLLHNGASEVIGIYLYVIFFRLSSIMF